MSGLVNGRAPQRPARQRGERRRKRRGVGAILTTSRRTVFSAAAWRPTRVARRPRSPCLRRSPRFPGTSRKTRLGSSARIFWATWAESCSRPGKTR